MNSIGASLKIGNKTIEGWAQQPTEPDVNNNTDKLFFRGRYDKLDDMLAAITAEYTAKTIDVSVSGAIAQITVYEVRNKEEGSGGIATPEDDVKTPIFQVVGTETEIDLAYLKKYHKVGDYSKKMIAAEKELKKANFQYIDALKATDPLIHEYIMWKSVGINTVKTQGYTANITRYIKLDKKMPGDLYSSVGSIVTWAGLPVDKSFQVVDKDKKVTSLTIPEPTISGETLLWRVSTPSVKIQSQHIEVTQSFIGALQWPTFYTGGNWDITNQKKDGGQ